MAIEIKQLVIKSSISDDGDDDTEDSSVQTIASIKKEVLDECRRLISESFRDRGQR